LRKFFVFLATMATALSVLAIGCNEAKATSSATQPPSSVPAISGQSLANTSWVMVSYGEPSRLTVALPQVKVTLIFNSDTTQASGNGGVNGYGGSVARTANQLTVSGILHSEMASTDLAVNTQENAYFQLLSAAQSVSFGTGTLTINSSSGNVLIFNAA
jgi:heat shock protein HslJ